MGVVNQIRFCLSKKDDEEQTEHVKRGEERDEHRQREKDFVMFKSNGQNRIFTEEAAQRPEAAEGEGAGEECPIRRGNLFLERAHFPNVLLVAERVDD